MWEFIREAKNILSEINEDMQQALDEASEKTRLTKLAVKDPVYRAAILEITKAEILDKPRPKGLGTKDQELAKAIERVR